MPVGLPPTIEPAFEVRDGLSQFKVKGEAEIHQVSGISRCGLDSCVFTNGSRRVRWFARDLRVGEHGVNDHPRHGVGFFPFRGSKGRVVGREGIGYSVDEMTELKTIVFNLGG